MTPPRGRKRIIHKIKEPLLNKLPPIVVVPDKTYMDDTGNIIPTDVILIADPVMYEKMFKVLMAWGKEPLGIPGKRGDVAG